MSTDTHFSSVIKQLQQYKRKYYLNKLVRGSIFFGAIVLSVYLLFNSIEYTARLGSLWRGVLFFSFLLLFLFILVKWVIDPLVRLYNNKQQISDEEAARQIGTYFPEVQDKLLNLIQLNRTNSDQGALLAASIAQKTKHLAVVRFPIAIDLRKNLRHLKYLAVPVGVMIVVLLFVPQFFSEGTRRIVNFNKEYVPEAPFSFNLGNESLIAFKNEDFTVDVDLVGSAIPDKAYLVASGRRFRMTSNKEGILQFSFQNIQRDTPFYIEAAGFNSVSRTIRVVDRPNLKNFSVYLDYPSYLSREDQRLDNIGNLQVPAGTNITWQFSALAADSMQLLFVEQEENYRLEPDSNGAFSLEKQALESATYQINLVNEYSSNKQDIRYYLDVIPDQEPQISLEQFQDTTLYQFLVLGGNVSDDYGLTQLALFYKFESLEEGESKEKYRKMKLPLDSKQNNQSYYYQWNVDTLGLNPGNKIRYFLKVWDNDAVNGYKSSQTSSYVFSIPDRETIRENIEKSTAETQSQISKTVQQAEQLKQDIEEVEKRLRGKKDLTWQDKKLLEDIVKQRQDLEKQLEQLKEQSQASKMQQEQFGEQSEKMKEQIDQLQQLMDELLDEETKKMYEELQKLLDEQLDMDKMRDQLQKINDQEENLEEELERTLELFKRMKFDSKLEDVQQQMEQKAEEQQKLAEETENKENDTEELSEQQEQMNEDFEQLQKEMEELNEMNQDLKNPSPMQDMKQEQQQTQQEQQKAQEALEKNQRKKAQKSQQKSAQQMKQMAQKMQQMQQSMEMEMLQENMDNLRNILDNLITLSFDQETVMKDFREVKQNDPRFIDLSQEQLKLRDDSQIIEDSLLALAERVFQIQSFVTREVKDMNKYMDESMESLRERQQYKAISQQQFAMTSINNLALLLNDVLSQMQQQMADAMGNPQQNPGDSQQNMNLSELQKQLNEQIQNLQKSGKSGRALSEELSKLAQQQEKIRKALEEMDSEEDGGGGTGDQLAKEMEETETDLVNKKLSNELIERQKQILTRLLDVEKSDREQELDQKRKGETAKDSYEKQAAQRFDEYIQLKKQEIELLKTVPLKLNPYYKTEANKYFKRLN
ncbi:DUF4175 family protein [Tunicatimonas pelagia]|uniref:DUF4175 family protein n=1 Tax=Tunicatimonas pelagia TaxID=931531 RepID=UPI002665BCDC|nr:DUF4175 family protein [Tunicatimonas pelagia]WKN46101.1 DUF4175 family protein [Tunicatimonas pelagia]